MVRGVNPVTTHNTQEDRVLQMYIKGTEKGESYNSTELRFSKRDTLEGTVLNFCLPANVIHVTHLLFQKKKASFFALHYTVLFAD